MKTLLITWQRLVDDKGGTCTRCAGTRLQLHEAVKKLEASLKPLDIEVRLVGRELDASACAADVTESNRIWIAGRPLESWLDARNGKSLCACNVCHNAECRTVEVSGIEYEVVPAELIIKAALIAAADAVLPSSEEPCCPVNDTHDTPQRCCK
ncbi:DUF2703 domain-containing protein [Pontibacterium granulatum]|uniref:DUF2703 domain-containing protein n=1 Tax=Pontibacterium granulatum TaxID=2036029 RepID=UPI00249C9BFA|nr:DUF2703 domain-containing protein [Pontibacterium granulatum]MDI3325587.1 DUF2703 domain-containing protein [Pontibacterium granulatum]